MSWRKYYAKIYSHVMKYGPTTNLEKVYEERAYKQERLRNAERKGKRRANQERKPLIDLRSKDKPRRIRPRKKKQPPKMEEFSGFGVRF